MEDEKILTIKVSAEIDVMVMANGERIIDGVKFLAGKQSYYAPEYCVSGDMDDGLLDNFKPLIDEAAKAPPPHA